MREIAKRVGLLSLFSPNETLEDISTRNLPFLFVPYVLAEVENRVRTSGSQERLARIRSIQVCCVTYAITPDIHCAFVHRISIVPFKRLSTRTTLYRNH